MTTLVSPLSHTVRVARRALSPLISSFSTVSRALSRTKAMPARSSSRFNPNKHAAELEGGAGDNGPGASSVGVETEPSQGQMRVGPGGIDASLMTVGKSTRSPEQRRQRRDAIRQFLEANNSNIL